MVSHRHIIKLDRVYETVDKFCLVLEICRGALSSVFHQRGKLEESEVQEIVRNLISAIVYLHKNGMLNSHLSSIYRYKK